MDKSEKNKIKSDIKFISKAYTNVSKCENSVNEMALNINDIAGSDMIDSDRRTFIDLMSVTMDMAIMAGNMMDIVADYVSPFGFVKDTIYELSYKDYKKMYGSYVNAYDGYRAAYDAVYDVYNDYARRHFFQVVPYIREV